MSFWSQAGAAMLGSLVLAVLTAIFGALGYGVIVLRELRDELRELEKRIENVETQAEVSGTTGLWEELVADLEDLQDETDPWFGEGDLTEGEQSKNESQEEDDA